MIHPKTAVGATFGGIGGSLSLIVAWILSLYGITVPSDVQGAISCIATIAFGFVGSYFAPNYEAPPTSSTSKGP
jgi:hypothetical protein